jgi:hypothetical protein
MKKKSYIIIMSGYGKSNFFWNRQQQLLIKKENFDEKRTFCARFIILIMNDE